MKKILISLIALTVMSTISCKKFLEEKPFDFLTPGNFPASANDADVALNGAYQSLAGTEFSGSRNNTFQGYGAIYTCELNDLVHDGFTSNYRNTSYAQAFSEAMWRTMFTGINSCNNLISSLEKNNSETWVTPKIAEAKALRALFYFYLVRWFGDLPLVLTPTTSGTINNPRSSVEDVYEQIISDLKFAEDKLPDAVNDGKFKNGSVKALLAQVYITRAGFHRDSETGTKVGGDPSMWALARDKAKEVIESGTYSLESDYTDIFKKSAMDIPCNEVILDIQYSTNSPCNFPYATGPEAYGSPGPIGGGKNWVDKINIEWLRRINPVDKRKSWNISDYMVLDNSWVRVPQTDSNRNILTVYPKWPEGDDSHRFYWDNYLYNWNILRLGEIKLLYAEAANEAASAPPPEAYTQINEIRSRAGLAPLSGLTKDQFRDAIMEERALELLGEGMRYFDLQRWGNWKEKIDANKLQSAWRNSNGAGVDEKWLLWPVPLRDVDANGWYQNKGW